MIINMERGHILNNRMRAIREELKLSRAAFGQRIGVSGDVINNLERGRVELKESTIKLLCSEFNVNEEYLRFGMEPKFIVTPSSVMEQLKKEFDLDEFSYNLVYEYLKLEPQQRNSVQNFFYKVINPQNTVAENEIISEYVQDNDFWESCTVEEAEKEYKKNLSKSAKNTESLTLNTTDGTDKAVNQ